MVLRLRPYTVDDEQEAVAAHELARLDQSQFLLGWEPSMAWVDFIESIRTQRLGLDLSEYRVRGCQLVADLDGELVGRASVRFELNEFFATKGGHIGYVVLPQHRRRGFATEILRQALVIARDHGVAPALLICDDDNLGSATAIERCGGVLEAVEMPTDGDRLIRRYWIA